MGVPGLFSFLRRRYPQICRPTEKHREGMPRSDRDSTDNLYIDMNHIIHSCTHAHVAKDRPDGLSREEQFGGMAAYLEALLDLLEPRRVVLIAVDGVAPRAKMNQQRTRRFLSAYVSDITDRIERDVKREMMSEAGGSITIPDVKRFDSNIITPGTEFMTHLARWLRDWAADKAANDTRFRQTTFIISDASEPGEGEHKIMKFVRKLRGQPGYDPNTRHIVYGQDADLLLLTLLCHEPYFRVMREDMQNAEATSGKTSREVQLAQEQQQLLQQRPLSAVAAALQQQQQQQLGAAALPQLPLLVPAGSGEGPNPIAACSDHLHMPCFETVDIAVLRECLQWEFSELVGPPGPPGMYGSDEEDDDSEDEESEAESGVDLGAGSEAEDRVTVTAGANHLAIALSDAGGGEESGAEAQAVEGRAAAGAAAAGAAAAGAAAAGAAAAGAAAAGAAVEGLGEEGGGQQQEQQQGSEMAAAGAAAPGVAPASSLSLSGLEALPSVGDGGVGDESSDELEDLLGLALCSSNNTAKTAASATGTDMPAAVSLAVKEEPAAAAGAAAGAAGLRLPPVLGLPPHLALRVAAVPGSTAAVPVTVPAAAEAAASGAAVAALGSVTVPGAVSAAAQPAAAADVAAAAMGAAAFAQPGAAQLSMLVAKNSCSTANEQPAASSPAAAASGPGLSAATGLEPEAAAALPLPPSVAGSSSSNNVHKAAAAAARKASSASKAAVQQQSSSSSRPGSNSSTNSNSSKSSGAAEAAAAGRSTSAAAVAGRPKRPPRQRGRPGLSFECMLDDLVVLTFLAGNDFLPNVPSIDIYDKPCGLDLLFAAYKALLPQMGGHLTSGGSVNRSRLLQLLVYLARDEESAYRRRADYRRRRAQQCRDEKAAAQLQLNSLLDGGLSMGELPQGVDLDALLSSLDPAVAETLGLSSMSDKPPPPDLTTLTPGQLCEELAGRVAGRVKDHLMGGDPWAQDPVGMDLPGYRQRYYEARFPELMAELDGNVDQVAARVAWDYMQGISWVLRYYTCGPAALEWQDGQQAAAAAAAGQQQEPQAEGGEEAEEGELEQECSGTTESRAGSQAGSKAAGAASRCSSHQGSEGSAAGGGLAGSPAAGHTGTGAGAGAGAPGNGAAAYADAEAGSSDGDDELMALLLGSEPPAHTQPAQQQKGSQAPQDTTGSSSTTVNHSSTGDSSMKDGSRSKAEPAEVASSTSSGKRASGSGKGSKGRTSKAASGSSSGGKKAASGIEGASWTWCFPHHYGPLMQDLAKSKLWQQQAGGRQDFSAPPVSLHRVLNDPLSCSLQEWGPPGGPVRPLLQLMCVLPAKSVCDALPPVLANVIMLAETMEGHICAASIARAARHRQYHHHQQQQQQQQQQGQQRGSKAARRAARKERRAAAALKLQGLSGLDVLAALGEEAEVPLLGEEDEEPGEEEAAAVVDEDGWGCDSGGEAEQAQQQDGWAAGQAAAQHGSAAAAAARNGRTAAAAAGAEYSVLLGFGLSGDAGLDQLQLAEELCAMFPNNVQALVDLTGKRWLHTGVVRLPMAQPQVVAAVLQAALALQQGCSGLTGAELLRNTFRPAAVVATARAAAAAAAVSPEAPAKEGIAAAEAGGGWSGCCSQGSSAATGPGGCCNSLAAAGKGATTTTSSSSSSSGPDNVWALLLCSAAEEQQGKQAGCSASAAAQSGLAAAAAAAGLGALGVLLGRRGSLGSIPSSTLQCLPRKQHRQEGEPVWVAALDVAGLPVPEHSCCLLPDAEPPQLAVTPAVWRHVAAGFSSAVSYAEKVLGIRSSTSTASEGAGGRAGRAGRGGRGCGAGRAVGRCGVGAERGSRGVDRSGSFGGSSSRAAGAGSGGPSAYAYGAGRQKQQQQQGLPYPPLQPQPQPQQHPYLDPAYYADDCYYAAGGSNVRGGGGYRAGRGRDGRAGAYGSSGRGPRYPGA